MKKEFTAHDREVVLRQINLLPPLPAKVINLRYWRCNSIADIAALVARDWDSVYAIINDTHAVLRKACLADPDFSRTPGVHVS